MNNENKTPEMPPSDAGKDSHTNWNEIQKKLQQKSKVSVKPYTLKELARIYKVSVPTFKKLLAPHQQIIGSHIGRYFTISQVKLIFQLIDQPSTYTLKNLARVYQVCIPTFKCWLAKFKHELGKKHGRYYSLKQLYIIIVKLDIPSVEGEEHEDFIRLLQLCA